jgi:diguanylate cyclase
MDSNEQFILLLAFMLVAQAALYLAIVRTKMKMRDDQIKAEDRLTGALSFSKFANLVDEELRRGGRYRYPVSLCCLDIDGFTEFNEQHGPKRGDELLRQFFQILKSTSRCADRIARSKGDDFWVLLPHTDQARAEKFLIRLQKETDEKLGIDFSAGIVHFQPGESSAQFLKKAESALTQAKGEGGRKIRQGSSDIPAALHL